jgi:hypothetical protein
VNQIVFRLRQTTARRISRAVSRHTKDAFRYHLGQLWDNNTLTCWGFQTVGAVKAGKVVPEGTARLRRMA